MPDVQKRVKDLRQKRAATKRAAKDKLDVLKANLKAAEREHLAAIDRKIRRAESRLRGQARRDDTRLKVLIGAAALVAAESSPQRMKLLHDELDRHLSRPGDRELCARLLEMPDLVGTTVPSTAAGSSADPILVFKPKRLPDGTWGARFVGDTSALPHELIGRQIRVTEAGGKSWRATVTEVLDRAAYHVLVRHSGKPES